MNHLSRRHFLAAGAAAGAGLALSSRAALAENAFATATKPAVAQPEAAGDPYALVDPQLRGALIKSHPIHLPADLPVFRKLPFEEPKSAPAPRIETRKIPGPKNAPPVELWICDPNPGRKNQPVLLHTHGGGYIAQNTHVFPFIQEIAANCQCVVVSVNYRLAPETKFPGSLDDNYTALLWTRDNAQQLGIDRERIAVGGESAGGGHAAALAIHARNRGEVKLVHQALIYPMLDDRTASSRAVPAPIGNFIWTRTSNVFGWESLLGVKPGGAEVPTDSVPARVADLSGLPPAHIGVGAIDLFVEEDIAYAGRLAAAGVPVELHVYPGAYHAFEIIVPDADVSKRFAGEWQTALRKAFNT